MFSVRCALGNVLLVPALRDNYIHLFIPHNTHTAIIIDPAEAAPVWRACAEHGLSPELVLNTHHHWDHTGGNAELASKGVRVAGPANEPIPARSHALRPNERLAFEGGTIEVIDAAGHTRGHLAYRIDNIVFVGDALFAAGCGRIFEGTPEQMWQTLCRLAALPPETLVFCAHEYTLANLRFARTLGLRTEAIEERIAREKEKRAKGLPTLPTTIAEELRTNPFLWPLDEVLRTKLASVFGVENEEVAVFAALRAAKDRFS